MRLGEETNGRSNEFQMQDEFEIWINDHNEYFKNWESVKLKYLREVTIKEVSRRADYLLIQDNRLINIELKTNPSETLMSQLIDHSIYCDYSFALIPDFCLIPRWFIEKMTKRGFGLIIYNHNKKVFTEALPAFKNKGRDLKIKKKYTQKFKKSQLKLES